MQPAPNTYTKNLQNRPAIVLGNDADHTTLGIEDWLINSGMMAKSNTPGFPVYLPAGQRVVNNLRACLRDAADAVGFLEMGFPSLYPVSLFETSGRLPLFEGTVFVAKREEGDFISAPTHEEWFSQLFTNVPIVGRMNEKNLPFMGYQMSKLWRDLFGSGERKSGKGLLKVNEFELFESYTLCADDSQLEGIIRLVDEGMYQGLFSRLGLRNLFYFDHRKTHPGELRQTKVYTDNLLPHPNGEYRFYVDSDGKIFDTPGLCLSCDSPLTYRHSQGKDLFACTQNESHKFETPGRSYITAEELELKRMFTVAMTMRVEDDCVVPFGAKYTGNDGVSHNYVMGTHGLGIGRLMMAIYDQHHDRFGMDWPKGTEPYMITIIPRKDEFTPAALNVWQSLNEQGITAIVDDRHGINAYPKVLYSEFVGMPFALQIGGTQGNLEYSVVQRGLRNDEVYKTQDLNSAINFIKSNYEKRGVN
ncbi:MAG: aminoacyl--tRNA ligase-related protein [archaeon]